MKLRRITAWALTALAVLVHVVAGVAGPGSRLCVCDTGVTIERLDAVCCPDEEMPLSTPDIVVIGQPDCQDCYFLPLPQNVISLLVTSSSTMAEVNLAAPHVSDVPAWLVLRTASWSAPPRYPPPDPLLRRIRTMILTC